ERALQTIGDYRGVHGHALQTTAAGLRYYVGKHSVLDEIRVGQRLKRLPTIIDKLCREPKMQLARMHDIAGCRAVVRSETEVRAIARHLDRRWDVVRHYDYMERPKPVSGYRAYHLVVQKEGHLVEVQLRTISQHAWAEVIESTDRRVPTIDLKSGRAPVEVLEYYRLGAELLASRERGDAADDDILKQFRSLHQQVTAYISENTTPNGS
ncbi:MAG TPA: RelA/SpoT domain-containing protein, partial [Solirubrobacteraceae bacterium]|nr:RelA/SpoT domain-containing protein [Solirubrobacteraceae bacterium]